MIQETIVFSSGEEFIRYVRCRMLLISNHDKIEMIKHEMAHYKKALELEYVPHYLIKINRGDGITSDAVFYTGQVIVDGDTSKEDLERIALAPINPSPRDKNFVLSGAQI